MGVLKNLTDEYFGKTERMEEIPNGVVRVNFTDNNGVFHRNGYRVENGDKDILKELIKRLIEKRGLEGDFNDIDVSNIRTMYDLFKGYDDSARKNIFYNFNGDITGWDVSSVENMGNMFWNAKSFNQPIGNWDVSSVTEMESMFCGATSFNQPIGSWKVDNVYDMSQMFQCSKFNGDINGWTVNDGVNMKDMFVFSPLEKNPPKWYKN